MGKNFGWDWSANYTRKMDAVSKTNVQCSATGFACIPIGQAGVMTGYEVGQHPPVSPKFFNRMLRSGG